MALSYEDKVDIFFGFYSLHVKLNAMSVQLSDLEEEVKRLRRREAMDAAQIQEKLAAQQEQIAANTSVTGSVSQAFDGLAQLIRDHIGDGAALEAIAASIDSNNTTLGVNNQTLADAVARNADVEPAPEAPPVETPPDQPVG